MSVDINEQVAHLVGWGPLFSPSTSESDAALILDRIAALGWAATVFTGGWGGKTLIRCCIMRSPAAPEYTVDVTAETRPLAICRAFIQAMERWGDEAQN